jgi:hypothetical protein
LLGQERINQLEWEMHGLKEKERASEAEWQRVLQVRLRQDANASLPSSPLHTAGVSEPCCQLLGVKRHTDVTTAIEGLKQSKGQAEALLGEVAALEKKVRGMAGSLVDARLEG